MKIKVSPVQQFYEQLERNKIQAELSSSFEAKPKRGRPRKNKLYFTQDTENAIIAYNNESDDELRNKVFNSHIHKPLLKMCENLVHRYKFYHFDATTRDVQYEVIAFLLEKLPKYTQEKGKAFSYFSIVAKNYLIQNNYKHYNHKKGKAPIIAIDTQRDLTNETVRKNKQEEIQDFYRLFIEYCEENMEKIIKYKRDIPIAYALIEIFKNCENIETYNKKALYIMVREMVDVKTQYITRVVNILKQEYVRLFKIYEKR
jgi:DNA invertase Pin-like site-specific DNA recombinase